ncbi:hypothetical protein [Vibrio algarum]|uniref:Uncharacterized protein n=1 Tax=Vibrio algarum TaxID=3020714 RepID=A0ABT4YXP2_9VIBR|nr:hypothetical protein [Vibrio sp. KJ40-1]MDB1126135.1 hypothetical protein [Vibrio sp. KJ40-1]
MLSRIGIAIQALLATSIFYLGYTIYSFTNTVSNVVDSYPQLLNEINNTATQLKLEQWLKVAEDIDANIPKALRLVEKINNTVEGLNQTARSIDKKVPLVLDEVTVLRTQTLPLVIQRIDTVTNTTIPNSLSELENYRTDVIPFVVAESKGYRTNTIPAMLSESKQLREEIPPVVDKIDGIVDKSEELSREVAEGAVKGVILSPIQIIRDAGTEIRSKVQID